jgi:thioredoxin reductase
MSRQTFIIVGASLAGAKAAEELRTRGFDGRVLLMGAECERPYERPPLTKSYLRGESEREKTHIHEQGFYEQHQIELLTDTAVTAIDTRGSRVTLGDGSELGFDRLLLATGAQPRAISYDVGMEYSGYAPRWDEVVFRGDPADGEFIAFWLQEGRVLAGMNVNVWDVNEHVQALIRSAQPIDAAALGDAGTPLDSLAAKPTTVG